MARRISCPACGSSEGFTLVRDIRVTTDINGDGEPDSGTEFANETDRRGLNCQACGHSWRTQRRFDIAVDVR